MMQLAFSKINQDVSTSKKEKKDHACLMLDHNYQIFKQHTILGIYSFSESNNYLLLAI